MGVTVDKGFLIPNGILKIIEIIINIIVMIVIGIGWGTAAGTNFLIFIAVLYFLWTLLMFLCFLLSVPDMIGGKVPWNIADLVHDVLAAFGYLVCFILAIFWGGIVIGVFCFLNLVAYVISLAFCVLEMQGKPIGKK